jgi:steroid delta-isomerase-like uncharacterized protein
MDNKELVRQCFEKGCNQRDTEGAAELLSDDYMLHDPSQPDFPGGREAFKKMCSGFMEAMRDASCVIEDQIAEGDKVVTRFTFSGCQTKDLPDIPSQGKCFKMGGINISRVVDGKIAEEWSYMDELGMRKQLTGAEPSSVKAT